MRIRLLGMRSTMKATQEAGLPRLFELETEYEEAQLVAELKFVRTLAEDIEAGRLQGMDMWRTSIRRASTTGGGGVQLRATPDE